MVSRGRDPRPKQLVLYHVGIHGTTLACLTEPTNIQLCDV